jgi:hypothetical protein
MSKLGIEPQETSAVRVVVPAKVERLKQVGHEINPWTLTLLPSESLDDALDPRFWRLIAQRYNINPGDFIVANSHNLTQVIVVQATGVNRHTGSMNVQEIFRRAEMPGLRQDADDGGDYRIEFMNDVTRGYAVVRKADKKLMKDGFRGLEAARAYIAGDLTARPLGR